MRIVAAQAIGKLDEAPSGRACPRPARMETSVTRRNLHFRPMSEPTRAPVDVFEKARNHDREEQLEAAKQGDMLPYFRVMTSQAGPVVEMEGRETIMLGSNNYLGLTDDPRVKDAAREALETYGTGLTGLAAAQRHDPASSRARARARRVDGDRGGDRLHHRPSGQRRLHRHDPRPRRHGDLRLGRPRLDPRRLQALGREAAPVSPQPDAEARAHARARRGRRRRRPGRRRRRLLDGGRPLQPAGDRRALRALRRPADGRRGARGRRARRPRRRHLRALRARGPRRSAHGHLLQEPRLLRRLHRRARRGDRVPAYRLAPVHLHRLGGSRRGRCGARRAAGDPHRGPGADGAAARQRRATCARASRPRPAS